MLKRSNLLTHIIQQLTITVIENMPVEIRELVIRTTIVDKMNHQENSELRELTSIGFEKIKQQIIESCVDQVLTSINKERER